MKNLSTGTGLALLATAIVAYPIVNRISSVDQTAHASVPVAAIAAAATAQANPEPTIVWYQAFDRTVSFSTAVGAAEKQSGALWVVRAWSDGKIEARYVLVGGTDGNWTTPLSTCYTPTTSVCTGPWVTISNPSEGYAYRSDITADQVVDGADLATMLADWGDAPRYDIPPSDCPLNLINP